MRKRLPFRASVELLEAEKGSEPRRFRMVANTGEVIGRSWGRMAVELEGVEDLPAKGLPILLDHEADPVAVAQESELTGEGLELSGYFVSTDSAKHVQKLADEGYPWTASVGIEAVEEEEVKADEEGECNGQILKGPISIWRRSRLFETSFITANPADKGTGAEVMADDAENTVPAEAPRAPEPVAAPAPQTVADLKDELSQSLRSERAEFVKAFPDRPKFAERAFMSGATLGQAKDHYARILQRRNAKLKAKLATRQGRIERLEQDRARLGLASYAPQRVDDSVDKGLSLEEHAARAWRSDDLLKRCFPEQHGGAKLLATVLKAEENQRVYETQPQGAFPPRFRLNKVNDATGGELLKDIAHALKQGTERYQGTGAVARLAGSFGRGDFTYSEMTVKGYLAVLFKPLEDDVGGNWATDIGLMVSSNQQTETHRFLGNYPQPREWLGNRAIKAFPILSQQITNKTYEATESFDVESFRYDKSGEIMIRLGEAGVRAAQHWQTLATAIILANPNCYDTTAFYGNTHPNIGSTAAGTQTNDFSALGGGTTGAIPSLKVAEPSNPTQLEAAAIIQQLVQQYYNYQDHTGSPVNGAARKILCMVPPTLWGPFTAGVRAQRLNLGADNPLLVQDFDVRVVPNGWLTTTFVGATGNTKTIYLFRTDSNFRPLVLQDVSGWEGQFLGPQSEQAVMKNRFIFGLKAVRGSGPGAWEHAIRAVLS